MPRAEVLAASERLRASKEPAEQQPNIGAWRHFTAPWIWAGGVWAHPAGLTLGDEVGGEGEQIPVCVYVNDADPTWALCVTGGASFFARRGQDHVSDLAEVAFIEGDGARPSVKRADLVPVRAALAGFDPKTLAEPVFPETVGTLKLRSWGAYASNGEPYTCIVGYEDPADFSWSLQITPLEVFWLDRRGQRVPAQLEGPRSGASWEAIGPLAEDEIKRACEAMAKNDPLERVGELHLVPGPWAYLGSDGAGHDAGEQGYVRLANGARSPKGRVLVGGMQMPPIAIYSDSLDTGWALGVTDSEAFWLSSSEGGEPSDVHAVGPDDAQAIVLGWAPTSRIPEDAAPPLHVSVVDADHVAVTVRRGLVRIAKEPSPEGLRIWDGEVFRLGRPTPLTSYVLDMPGPEPFPVVVGGQVDAWLRERARPFGAIEVDRVGAVAWWWCDAPTYERLADRFWRIGDSRLQSQMGTIGEVFAFENLPGTWAFKDGALRPEQSDHPTLAKGPFPERLGLLKEDPECEESGDSVYVDLGAEGYLELPWEEGDSIKRVETTQDPQLVYIETTAGLSCYAQRWIAVWTSNNARAWVDGYGFQVNPNAPIRRGDQGELFALSARSPVVEGRAAMVLDSSGLMAMRSARIGQGLQLVEGNGVVALGASWVDHLAEFDGMQEWAQKQGFGMLAESVWSDVDGIGLVAFDVVEGVWVVRIPGFAEPFAQRRAFERMGELWQTVSVRCDLRRPLPVGRALSGLRRDVADLLYHMEVGRVADRRAMVLDIGEVLPVLPPGVRVGVGPMDLYLCEQGEVLLPRRREIRPIVVSRWEVSRTPREVEWRQPLGFAQDLIRAIEARFPGGVWRVDPSNLRRFLRVDRAQVVAEVREAREASLVALLGLAMLPASWPQELAFVVVIVVAALVLALWSRSAERTLGEGPTGPGDDDGLTHRPRHGEPTGEALLDPTPFLPITSGAGDDAAEVSAVICAGIVGSLALALDEHHAAVADRLGLNDAEVGLMRRHDLVNCCARWSAVGCMLGIGREFGGGMAVECDLFATRKGSPLFEHLQAIHLALHAALHDDVRAPLHGARAIASAHRLAVHLFPDLRLVKWSLHPVDSEGKCVGWRFPRRCYAENVLGVFAAQFMGAER